MGVSIHRWTCRGSVSHHTNFVICEVGRQIRSEVFERCLVCRHDRSSIIRRVCWVILNGVGVLEEDFEQVLRDCYLSIKIVTNNLLECTEVVVAGLSIFWVFGECLPEQDKSVVGGIGLLDRWAELHIREHVDDVAEVADLLFVAVTIPFYFGNECGARGYPHLDGIQVGIADL